MPLPGNLLITAMGVMPHKNVDQALKAAMSLDIPFCPQLPRYSYYEDMYVQAAEHFPGIVLDIEKQILKFSMDKFNDPEYFDVSETYSAVYHRFLSLDLTGKPAIRGQLENIWKQLDKRGIDTTQILKQSMLSPATCCLINPDKEKTVEKAFKMVKNLSQILKTKYKII